MTKVLSEKEKKKKLEIEEVFRTGDQVMFTRFRRLLALLPSDPRCVTCMAPFEGTGGSLVRALMHRKRSTMNPLMCDQCEETLRQLEYGAETEMAILFADIRGSTTLAENMTATEFKNLIDRFYNETSHILVHSYAIIDKIRGDEINGYYMPTFTGQDFAERAVKAARDILAVTGHHDAEGPWAPVGVGIHTGQAYYGAVSSSEGMVELTALGDAVNTASRLASKAGIGEIILSEETVRKASVDTANLEKRTLELKGKSALMDAWVMKIA
jgi:adenylate cyclase